MGFWAGLVLFGVTLVSSAGSDFIAKLPEDTGRAVAMLAAILSASCLALGTYHALKTWVFIDLLQAADDQGVGTTRREGLILWMVSAWPFVMIVMGLFATILYGRTYLMLRKKR